MNITNFNKILLKVAIVYILNIFFPEFNAHYLPPNFLVVADGLHDKDPETKMVLYIFSLRNLETLTKL